MYTIDDIYWVYPYLKDDRNKKSLGFPFNVQVSYEFGTGKNKLNGLFWGWFLCGFLLRYRKYLYICTSYTIVSRERKIREHQIPYDLNQICYNLNQYKTQNP